MAGAGQSRKVGPVGSQIPGLNPSDNSHVGSSLMAIGQVPLMFGSVWTSTHHAQRLLRTDGLLSADADRVHRALLAQVLEYIGPDYALGILRLVVSWCAGDLRDRPAVNYLHCLRASWSRDLSPIMCEPREPDTDPASVSFAPLLQYNDLAHLVTADSARQLSEDFELLASDAAAPGDLVEAPRPDEVLWVTGLATGLRTLDVALQYGVSERTLYRRLGECRSRYKVDSNRELVTVFARNGWLAP